MFGKEQRQRNLNYAETLDKLLGTDDKGRITQNIDANLKTTPQQRLERPATRHGRQTIEKPSDAATTASSVIATVFAFLTSAFHQ
ncbi:unnamed protein product [Anisakis simplex]|uniref:Uncharacterized protein n=1 Tax=Anisakis simplex TaxID=6269 RepID=A0A0M3IY60_ANISI|nr:unnamed protein product [Anisakis simplex]